MNKTKVLRIKNTNSFLFINEEDKTLKVLINDANDIANIIVEVNTLINNSIYRTDFLGIKPDIYGNVNINCQFGISEQFGILTEDKFLEDFHIYSNPKYKSWANALRFAIKDFDVMCEKYKLLLELNYDERNDYRNF